MIFFFPPPPPLPLVINTTIDIHNQLFHLRRICNGLKASHAHRMRRCKLTIATSNRLPRQLGVSNNMDVNAGCHQARSTWQSCKDRSLLKRCYFQFVSLNAHFYIFVFRTMPAVTPRGRGVKVQSTVTLCVWSRPLCGVVVFLTCLPSRVLSVSPFWSTSTHTVVSLKPALCEVRLKCWVCVRLGEGTCAV